MPEISFDTILNIQRDSITRPPESLHVLYLQGIFFYYTLPTATIDDMKIMLYR